MLETYPIIRGKIK